MSACFLALVFSAATGSPAYGTTLWAAAGTQVQDGGVLVAKNHDDRPAPVEPRLVIPRKGFTYLGLFPVKGSKGEGPLAGVNEKGFAVVTASPESLPPGPDTSPSMGQISEKLLAVFESVNGALSDHKIFREGPPAFYLLGDNSQIAYVEVTPHHEIAVKRLENGILCHSGHYVDEKLLSWNKKNLRGSELRLQRITQLLGSSGESLTPDRFTEIAHDRGTDADDGILKTQSSPGPLRTVSTWILFIPRSGAPELHAGIFGPDGAEREYDFKLDRPFWTEGLR